MSRTTAALIATALTFPAALFLASPAYAGGGCHEGPEVFDSRSTTVTMSKFCFSPTVARVDEGKRVTFANEDPLAHTVTGAADRFGDYDEMLEGDEVVYRFDEPGTYPYFCQLHPGMVGVIVVGDGIGTTATGTGDPVAELDAPLGLTDSTGSSDSSREPASSGIPAGVPFTIVALIAVAAGATVLAVRARRFARRSPSG